MPLANTVPEYVDTLSILQLYPFNLDSVKTFSHTVAITCDWHSPGTVPLKGEKRDVLNFGSFYLQNDVPDNCGRKRFKSYEKSGTKEDTEDNPVTYAGANTLSYEVDPEDGSVLVEETVGITISIGGGDPTPVPNAPRGEPISPEEDIDEGFVSGQIDGTLSEELGYSDQSTVLGEVLDIRQGLLDTASYTPVLSNSSLLAAQEVGANHQRNLQGATFAVRLPSGVTVPAEAEVSFDIIVRQNQVWRGYIGTSTVTVTLSEPDENNTLDEYGTYKLGDADLEDTAWRTGFLFTEQYLVKFVSLDGRVYRITVYNEESGETTYTMAKNGNLIETENIDDYGGVFEVEVQKGEDWEVVPNSIIGEGGDIFNGVKIALMSKYRTGQPYGFVPFTDTTEDIYKKRTLSITSEFNSEATCDCGDPASFLVNYIAEQTLDDTNGYFLAVETLTNEGSLGLDTFIPFPSGYWETFGSVTSTTEDVQQRSYFQPPYPFLCTDGILDASGFSVLSEETVSLLCQEAYPGIWLTEFTTEIPLSGNTTTTFENFRWSSPLPP